MIPNKAQRDVVFSALGYKPSFEQEAVHARLCRVALVAGGERGGKSYSSSMDLMARLPFGKLYWLVAQDYERTGAEFNYIIESLTKIGATFEASKRIDPGEIEIAGGIKIQTKSAKDPRKLAMDAPDGILACEASQLDYDSFLRLRGRIAEKRGWLLMSGTFESSLGWYPELYNRWQSPNEDDALSFSLPSWSNLAIYPGGRQDPEILALERLHSKDWFLERLGGVPCPPKGRVFTEFSNAIHCGNSEYFEFDPTSPCFILIDPGYDHACAVEVVQMKDGTPVVVDEIYETGFVTSDIITVAQQKPWWSRVSMGVIDIAGRQHASMPAPIELWQTQGQLQIRSNQVPIEDGIERLKMSLKVNPVTGRPAIYINTKCRGLISELGGCPSPLNGQVNVYKWKTDKDGNVVGSVPEDKNNDAIKALTYGLVETLGFTKRPTKPKIVFR